MTDPLSLRAMAEQLRILAGPYQNSAVSRICREAADAIEALLAAQSSWANEKAADAAQIARLQEMNREVRAVKDHYARLWGQLYTHEGVLKGEIERLRNEKAEMERRLAAWNGKFVPG